MVVGVDEVGRGCWAGPLLVVAAKSVQTLPTGLKDSKLLSQKQRDKLMPDLIASCQFGEGWVEPSEIDRLGLSDAMRLGVLRALNRLKVTPESEIIIDGNINYCGAKFVNARAVIKADSEFPLVSAASIYAKVLRDQRMRDLALVHTGYGFEQHVGYGTAKHAQALAELGPCEIHRRSFKPVMVSVNG